MRRVRRSTWVTLAIFVVALVTYILVRPDNSATHDNNPSVTTSSVSASSTTTTTLRLVP
jgi:hypothetical protein